MTATFLVTLDLEAIDPATLAAAADDISDALTSSGEDVVSVAPWSRPTLTGTPPTNPPPLGT